MVNLSIRKLDDEIYEQLRQRAARHGVSMEEEVRQLLRQAVSPPDRLGDVFVSLFGKKRGAQLEIAPREHLPPVDLKG